MLIRTMKIRGRSVGILGALLRGPYTSLLLATALGTSLHIPCKHSYSESPDIAIPYTLNQILISVKICKRRNCNVTM
jgi:predicted transcriptional regulator